MADHSISELSLEFNRHIVNLLDSLSALSELSELSIHDFDEPQLLKHALKALMSNQDMERSSIFLMRDDGLLTNVAGLDWEEMLGGLVNEEAPTETRPKTQFRLGEGVMGRAAESGQQEHCRSCIDDPRFKALVSGDITVQGSLLCVPICCEDSVLGVLNIFHPQAGFFNMWHERLLLLFCQVLGRLLLNHRFTHHLGDLLDNKTREIMVANAALCEEAELRRKAQEKLEHQYGFLQSVLESAPEPIMVIGTDYRLLMANALSRVNVPQMLDGKELTCYQISHHRDTPCDGTEHQCPLQMVVAQNGPASVTHVHHDSAGEPRHIELLASPLRDKNGAVIGIIENARDITDRMRMQDALLESEARFRLLFNSGNDAILVHRIEANGMPGQFIEVNDRACHVLGYSRKELLSMGPTDIDVADSASDMAKISKSILARQYATFEWVHRARSGKKIPVEISAHLFQLGGQPAVFSVARDITERKQAELEYKTILQTATDGYLMLDAAQRVIDTNDAYCAMLGYSREELLRMRTPDIEAIESPDETQRHADEIRRQGYARFESQHRRKDGRILDVDVSTTFLDIQGGVLIAFIRDISERKQVELQIRQLAYFDTLTDLPNRRLLLDRLGNALTQAKRFERSLAVMFLDLDRFKQVNDTLGHDAGDELLIQVARRLNACVRAGDTVSRPGGDEFVILLPEISNPHDAELVAEKIIASLNKPITIQGQVLLVTTSIGISVEPINGTDDIQELMKKADQAMYQAKDAGRNTYQFYQDAYSAAPERTD